MAQGGANDTRITSAHKNYVLLVVYKDESPKLTAMQVAECSNGYQDSSMPVMPYGE